MRLSTTLRNSAFFRKPLLALTRACLSPLTTSIPILRRAAYDAEALPYLVTGDREKYVVSTQDKVIGRELFLHGEFDFQKLVTALAILHREGRPAPRHLIDVGANIGTILIPALARGLMESATAIEPHPENLKLLRANLALNGVADKARVLPQAVGAESAATLFLRESSSNSGNHSVGDAGIPILSSKLDDIESPCADALLWMDIEGYEGHALNGAANLLASGISVVCEVNPSFLKESGGEAWFFRALANHTIFDLSSGPEVASSSLHKIMESCTKNSDFTDILAISSFSDPRK